MKRVRRLARRLFPLAAAVSLLMCVGLCVLWARSYDVAYSLSRHERDPATADRHDVMLYLCTGRVSVSIGRWNEADEPGVEAPRDDAWHLTPDPIGLRIRSTWGFAVWQARSNASGRPTTFGP